MIDEERTIWRGQNGGDEYALLAPERPHGDYLFVLLGYYSTSLNVALDWKDIPRLRDALTKHLSEVTA